MKDSLNYLTDLRIPGWLFSACRIVSVYLFAFFPYIYILALIRQVRFFSSLAVKCSTGELSMVACVYNPSSRKTEARGLGPQILDHGLHTNPRPAWALQQNPSQEGEREAMGAHTAFTTVLLLQHSASGSCCVETGWMRSKWGKHSSSRFVSSGESPLSAPGTEQVLAWKGHRHHDVVTAQPPAYKLMEHVCSRTWSHTKSTMSLVWVCWTQEMPDCPLCWGQSILSNQLHVLSPAHITNENPSSPWQHLEWCTYSNPCLPADFWWTALTAFKCCAVPQWTTPLSTWQWDISLLFPDTNGRVSWE